MDPRPATVIYDGGCGFCRRSVEALIKRDTGGHFAFLPLQDPQVAARWPGLDPAKLNAAMHLILPDGRILAGAAAAPEIMRRLPRWRHLAWMFSLPGIPALASRIYALIARNRHRLGCRTSGCSVKR
ncbi:MAG: thiol-disulfide oxidoreductase DCC family protein [Candidatus Polarisedimenticolia bacterium]